MSENHDESPAGPASAKTFPQLIRAAAAAYGDDIAVRFQADDVPDETISFAQLDSQSAKLARGLLARGVGKGSRVGFIYGNGPGFALMLAAIARIGAIAIPISTMIRANELVRVIRQSDAAGLIVQREWLGNDYVQRLVEALPELAQGTTAQLRIPTVPYLRWILSSGDGLPPTIADIGVLAEEAASVSDALLSQVEAEIHTTDQMVEIYTSGSMALPKGVKHNHGPVLFRAHYMRGALGLVRGKETYAHLPMFWVGGMMMYLLPNWEAGATTLCSLRTLNDSRIAMGVVLAEDELKKMAQQPKPWWGLGMSETLGPYSYGDEFRAPGYPVCAPMDHFADGYEVRVADENDQPVGDGGIGEMQVRGLAVTPGIHKLEREGYYTADGYYHTGDMCLVEGSRVHFVGRGGEMIKTAGANVSPAEVEMELQTLEGIHSAYVLGLEDAQRGQLVVAALVAREGSTLDFGGIEAEMRKRLSSYKVPRAYIEITRGEVPLLHSNKVARRQLAQMVAERLGRA